MKSLGAWVCMGSCVMLLSACRTAPSSSEAFSGYGQTSWVHLLEDESRYYFSEGSRWALKDQTMCNISDSDNGFMISRTQYGDFELLLEFRPDAQVNSGIFVRCRDATFSPTSCYELNIWDNHPDQSNRTGSIVGIQSAGRIVNTNNQWNTMRVIAVGARIQIWINNILTMDYADADMRASPIGFQAFESGEICFRNIRIQSIE